MTVSIPEAFNKFCNCYPHAVNASRFVCQEQLVESRINLNYIRDEGRPLEAVFQEKASNHLKLLWLNTKVVSVKGKGY